MKRLILPVLILALTLCGCGGTGTSTEQNNTDATSQEETAPEEAPDEIEVIESDDTEPDVLSDAIRAYSAFIETNEAEDTYPFQMNFAFGLVHVDADDIPELVVISNDAHADAVFFYSYDGADVTELDAVGGFGTCCYERGNGILFGFYTGNGITTNCVTIVENGRIQDSLYLNCSNLSLTTSFDETGYGFFTGTFENPEEISRKDYLTGLEPYLPLNREYSLLSYDDDLLPRYRDIEDPEESLRLSLDLEDSFPKAEQDVLLSSGMVIYPKSVDDEAFEDEVLPKLQGVWTSVGHSRSTSWVIEGKKVKIYEAVWKDLGKGLNPTGEYKLDAEKEILLIDANTDDRNSEFFVFIDFSGSYYGYREADGQILLDDFWDPDGYSGSSSMFKDDTLSPEDFE